MHSDSWGHEFCPLFGGRRCPFVGGQEYMECMLLSAGGTEFVHWWEVVCSSECPLLDRSTVILTQPGKDRTMTLESVSVFTTKFLSIAIMVSSLWSFQSAFA